jgi:hypothetical protein
MAKRNRNRKRKNKQLLNEEEQKIEKVNEQINKNSGEKTIEPVIVIEIEKEENIPSAIGETTPKEKKKMGLFKQVLTGSFILLLALPTGYYFSKISPEHATEITKLSEKNINIKKEFELKISDMLKTNKELEEKLKKESALTLKTKEELALIQKKSKLVQKAEGNPKVKETLLIKEKEVSELEKKLTLLVNTSKTLKNELNSLKSSTQVKEQAFNEKFEKEAKKKKELQEQIIFLITKGKELEDVFNALSSKEQDLTRNLQKEAKKKKELQEQIILLITKGKKLEDKFKILKSSISSISEKL